MRRRYASSRTNDITNPLHISRISLFTYDIDLDSFYNGKRTQSAMHPSAVYSRLSARKGKAEAEKEKEN
jgi:hypothetical protein